MADEAAPLYGKDWAKELTKPPERRNDQRNVLRDVVNHILFKWGYGMNNPDRGAARSKLYSLLSLRRSRGQLSLRFPKA
jgi:hypothetical protein